MSDIKDTKYSEKRRLGNLGEDIAEMFLVKRGYKIVNRNYLKKWGELDIVATKDRVIFFIEVKSKVTREMGLNRIDNVSQDVSRSSFTKHDFNIKLSHETNNTNNEFLPEENVHSSKLKRMYRAIQSYLTEKSIDDNIEWQIDVMTVAIDFVRKEAIINHIENVVID